MMSRLSPFRPPWRRRGGVLGLLILGTTALSAGGSTFLAASLGASTNVKIGLLGGLFGGVGVAALIAAWWIMTDEGKGDH